MKKHCAVMAGMSLILAGCVSKGPLPVYTQAGVAAPDPNLKQYPNANPLLNFQSAASNAQSLPSSTSYQQFMRSGFALIYIRCNEYFDQKGTDQARANLLRDSIAPLAAVVTGLFALHNYKDVANADHDIGLLTLGSTTAVAGLDVYSRNFLFGAENIDSVRQMVNEELNTHASAALGLTPASIEEAALQITDNQRVCTPAHILASTRAAIANGRFAARVDGVGGPVATDLLTDLGTALNLTPPTITEAQAGLIYATVMGLVRSDAEIALVHTKLASLGASNPVSDDGTGKLSINSGFPFAQIKQIFDAAPAATRAYLLNRSKIVMAGVNASAKADALAVRSASLTGAALANPSANLDAFLADMTLTDYSLPPASAGALRRVRVTSQ